MTNEVDLLEMPGAVILWLDQVSGELFDCGGAVQSMLDLEEGLPQGSNWRDVLGLADSIAEPLSTAIKAGISATLPPLTASTAQGREIVLGGSLAPAVHLGRRAMALLLREIDCDSHLHKVGSISAADTLAVVGVDRLVYDRNWGVQETARFMVDIRFGLLQIIPPQAVVGLPVGSSILLVLRDMAIAEALTIAPALLSHLHTVMADREDGAKHARMCLGLARVSDSQTPLAAVAAANSALMHAQLGDGDGRIVVAGEGDDNAVIAQAINANGLFSGNRQDPESLAYLAAVTALEADPRQSTAYLAKLCELTLEQAGVAAIAVYRRCHDDSFEYVAGGLVADDGKRLLAEKQLPRSVRQRVAVEELMEHHCIAGPVASAYPLGAGQGMLGYLSIAGQPPAAGGSSVFIPGVAVLHHLAGTLSAMADWRMNAAGSPLEPAGVSHEIEMRIEGYVSDNMEGAIDQAVFLARVDIPVAVIGPRGTGKLYVAKFIHQEAGGAPDQLLVIECRDFRGRREALARINRELAEAEGKTLVFKSPHLMNADVQLALARQIGSRILADSSPPRYLPPARFVGLFPSGLEHLVAFAGLNDKLASVFAGYPIQVPPLKDRKRAVMRWAYKILGQESNARDRRIKGFTPDAEQAMREYHWPGNISEMRETITTALDKTDKEWITPVDLGIFKGISADGSSVSGDQQPFLAALESEVTQEVGYIPDVLDELRVALAEALHNLLELETLRPLGAWLDDELVLAVCERYRGDMRGAARFLHTRSRNVSRWMPKILSREQERNASSLWQAPRKLIHQWINETGTLEDPPQKVVQDMLMSHVLEQCDSRTVADKARIMGVSTPTYQKRLREIDAR